MQTKDEGLSKVMVLLTEHNVAGILIAKQKTEEGTWFGISLNNMSLNENFLALDSLVEATARNLVEGTSSALGEEEHMLVHPVVEGLREMLLASLTEVERKLTNEK